jgi:hypothetical protein
MIQTPYPNFDEIKKRYGYDKLIFKTHEIKLSNKKYDNPYHGLWIINVNIYDGVYYWNCNTSTSHRF